MRLAEVLMRMGAALVGLLVGVAHCILLLVIPEISCDIPGNDPFFASLALAFVLGALLFITQWGLPFRETLRWLTLPFVALVPLAVRAILAYVGIEGATEIRTCSASAAGSEPAFDWPTYWAPLQLIVLGGLAFQALRFWRAAPPGE